MKHKVYFLWMSFLFLTLGCASLTQKSSSPSIASVTLEQHSFEELDSLIASAPRPIAVFFHTDWCKYCHTMSQTTLQDDRVVELLNRDYYFISFDAEQKESVIFRNHLFRYQARGRTTGTHELATALGTMEDGLAYPAMVLLNKEYEIVFQYNAFMNARTLRKVLKAGNAEQTN